MAAQDFFRTYLPYARSVSEQTGIDPRLVLAQAALETGYGKSAPNYNFFGIKGSGQNQQTKEFRDGKWVTENAGFRAYSDPSGSFADYADLMMNSSRYEPVRAGRTLEEQIAAMASSGYATDPNYGAKLTKIASMIDYNSPDLIGADAMRALGKSTGAIPVIQKRTEAPMGLLNMGQPSGQQAPAQAQGSGFWDKFAGGLLSDPDRRARLAMALEGMTLRPNQGVIAAAQSGIDERKTQATLNKTIEWLRGQPNGEAYIRMIEAGASPAQVIQAMMQERSGGNVPAAFQALAAQAKAAGLEEGTPEYRDFMLYGGASRASMPAAFEALHQQALAAGLEAGSPEYQQFMLTRGAGEAASAKAIGAAQGGAASQLAGAEVAMNNALNLVGLLRNDPALPKMVGPIQGRLPNISADSQRFQSRLDQLQGVAFLEAYNMLRGGGQITEVEGKKAEAAMARLKTAQNEQDFLQALSEFEDAIRTGFAKLQASAGTQPQTAAPSASPTQTDDPLGLR